MPPPTFLIKSKLIVSAVFLWRFIFSDNKCMRGLMSLEYNIAMRSYPIILRDLHNDFPMYCWECDEICQNLKINMILVEYEPIKSVGSFVVLNIDKTAGMTF